MNEIIVIIGIVGFYIFISYKINKFLVKLKIVYFILTSILYLLFTNYLFDFLFYVDRILSAKKIYIEFGHANLDLFVVFGFCILIAMINIIIAVINKVNRNKSRDMLLEISMDDKKV